MITSCFLSFFAISLAHYPHGTFFEELRTFYFAILKNCTRAEL